MPDGRPSSGLIARSLGRPCSTPEHLGLTGLGMTAAAFVYPSVSHATGLGLPCPLRTLTGVPCPMCGMTTAATALAGGRLHDALAANPFVLVLAAGTLVMVLLLAARLAGVAPSPVPWSARRRRGFALLVGVLAAASWIFELHRFGWV